MKMDSLDDLIFPISIDVFFSEYWERKYLHLPTEHRGRFANLINIDFLDYLISTNKLPKGSLVVTKQGKLISDYPDTREAIESFAAGATLIFNTVDRIHPELGSFCHNLEKEIEGQAQANIYLTPEQSQGFDDHFDTHDVFILQLLGEKTWRMYGNHIELPLSQQKEKDVTATSSGNCEEIFLTPGDVLYIPRGIVHSACSNASTSCHVTIGIHTNKVLDGVLDIIKNIALSDLRLRSSMCRFAPISSAETEDISAVIAQKIVEELPSWKKTEGNSHRRNFDRGALMQFIEPQNLSRFKPYPHVKFDLIEDEYACLQFEDKEIRFPLRCSETLESIFKTGAIHIDELPESLSKDSKRTLINRLVKEGALYCPE